ncbi:MAG: SGNH/GDSL hydrolase N-terminal domain-containing protein, partial [Bacteroides sp.]
MKTFSLSAVLLLFSLWATAQTVYHDASQFPLLGKATQATATRYERLPDSLRTVLRKPLWELGQNSAGLAVRFRSNSTAISAKWEVLLNRNMNHMTPTGIKGLDLYCLDNGHWRFAGSGRPSGKVNRA